MGFLEEFVGFRGGICGNSGCCGRDSEWALGEFRCPGLCFGGGRGRDEHPPIEKLHGVRVQDRFSLNPKPSWRNNPHTSFGFLAGS